MESSEAWARRVQTRLRRRGFKVRLVNPALAKARKETERRQDIEAFENEEPELRKLHPFTSADLDLFRPDSSASRLLHSGAKGREDERDPFGKAFTIVSHTFLIENQAGHVLTVDALKTVPGLGPAEMKKGTMVVESAGVTL